ncbi:MAG: MOSC domain-containing protein [Rhodoglobus sp.]
MALISAVCVVSQLRADPGTDGVTAIDKRSMPGATKVGPFGLRGDVQVSRKHHGGLDKALYLYSQSDADFWSAELDRELKPGWFGENLRVEGLDVNAARVGERWRIGVGANAVDIEMTTARIPCQIFARWVGAPHERGWVKRFAEARRPGAYARVVRTGAITAGDEISVLHVPVGAPTIAESFRGL